VTSLLCPNAVMNPFRFSSDDSSVSYANPARVEWFPRQHKWKWPADYRSLLCWVFAATFLTSLLNLASTILHPRSRTLLENLLLGPMFYAVSAAIWAVALWAIWKDKSWARPWAVVASSIYLLEFLRQIVVLLRPAWDHHLSPLLIGILGVVAFSWHSNSVRRVRLDTDPD
jgi:uncharacterized membrane protein (DUF2068 family)